MSKRFLSLLVAISFVFALSACGSGGNQTGSVSDPSPSLDAGLVEKSMAHTAVMAELAADSTYAALMSTDPSIRAVFEDITQGDYTTPKSVQIYEFPEDMFRILAEIYEVEATSSPAVLEVLERRMANNVGSLVTARSGYVALAAASILSVDNSYRALEGLDRGCVVLLIYEGDYGSMTSFLTGHENTMTVTASFVPLDILGESGRLSEVTTELAELGIVLDTPRIYEGEALAELLDSIK